MTYHYRCKGCGSLVLNTYECPQCGKKTTDEQWFRDGQKVDKPSLIELEKVREGARGKKPAEEGKPNEVIYTGVTVCPDCGGKISIQAMACPHCGKPLRRSYLAAGILALTLGCLGAHNLYLKRKRGWVQFVITALIVAALWFSVVFSFSSVFVTAWSTAAWTLTVSIWAMIEGAVILNGGQDYVDRVMAASSAQGEKAPAMSNDLPEL